MTRLIVLDRDGVINHDSATFIKRAREWRPIAGSLQAIAQLNRAGYTVAVASNQSGVGRGLFDEAELTAIHNKMFEHVAAVGGHIDKVVFCPHLPDAGCTCRKPKAGLLEQLGTHYAIDFKGVPVVGDSERDLQAAAAVGAQPLLVLTGNGKETLSRLRLGGSSPKAFADLAEVANSLCNGGVLP